jgi:hypothetical protein
MVGAAMNPTLRAKLTPMPDRIKRLTLHRGFPVPWFVAMVDGEPDFRIMSTERWAQAIQRRACWTCGETLGANLAFVSGPMCGISRTSAEPPSHVECARWSVANCPFLSQPKMVRRDSGLPEGATTADGLAIMRNPGVAMIWVTRSFQVWRPESGGKLIEMGEPIRVEWYSEGRPATRAEVEESIRTGLPSVQAIANTQVGAPEALERQLQDFRRLLPEK